jgi:hypothetical protein
MHHSVTAVTPAALGQSSFFRRRKKLGQTVGENYDRREDDSIGD